MDSAPSFVDSIEIYGEHKVHTGGAANLLHLDRQQHDILYRRMAPRPESGAEQSQALPSQALPTSWLVFDKQRYRPQHKNVEGKKDDSHF